MKLALIGTTAGCVLGFRADLIQALVDRGDEVYAFAIDYDAASRAKVRAFGAVPVDYSFSRAGLNPLSDMLNTLKLTRTLKTLAPDVVLTYFAKPVIFGTLAARLAKIPKCLGMLEGLGFLFTVGPNGQSRKVRLLKRIQVALYKLSIPRLDCLIFLNPDDRHDLVGRYTINVRDTFVLGGIGLNLADYPLAAPVFEPVRFLFIGRLLAEKGVNEFVGAARRVKAMHPTAEFVLLGGLDNENPGGLSQATLDRLTTDGIVIYPGFVEDVRDWLARSSVFVLPSYREGVPRSTQEAMAMGRAIITTDVPGCRQTVEQGVNGFIVPPWSETALAEKMCHFIENPGAIEEMGQQSHRLATDRFDARVVNQRLVQRLLQG